MLASESTMNADYAARNTWGHEEWDKVAAELQRAHHNWPTHEFSMSEFEDAMEAVILQEQQRTFRDMDDVTPHLHMAFARRGNEGNSKVKNSIIAKRPAVNSLGNVLWSPDEWESVVLEIHQLVPDAFASRLEKLRLKDVLEAQKVLPVSRHRHYKQIVTFRMTALKIWDALPADVRNPMLQDRKIVNFPSGSVMEPPRQKSDNNSAMALAIHKGFNAPEKPEKPIKIAKEPKPGKQKRNSYSDEDWLNIARVMHRQNPHAPYFTSSFTNVDVAALHAAEREVIPAERRRKIKGNFGLAKPMVAAFAALKLEQEQAVLHVYMPEGGESDAVAEAISRAAQVEPAEKEAEPEAVVQVVAVEQPVPPPVPTPAYQQQVAVEAAPVSGDFLARLAAASKPLIGVIVNEFRNEIAQEVAKILLPQLTSAVGSMLGSAVTDMKNAINAQFDPWKVLPAAAPVAPAPAAVTAIPEREFVQEPVVASFVPVAQPVKLEVPKPVEKPKKPVIAVIFPLTAQRQHLTSYFPNYDFIFIEEGRGIQEAGQRCVLFVAVNAYTNTANRGKMKAYVAPEKIRFVEGSLSAVRRTINQWIATQKH